MEKEKLSLMELQNSLMQIINTLKIMIKILSQYLSIIWMQAICMVMQCQKNFHIEDLNA